MSRFFSDPNEPVDGCSEERFLSSKQELHEQLIASMDLKALGSLGEDDLRIEVRRAAEELCRQSARLLSFSERERP